MLLELTAGADDNGRRLDRILRKALPEMPLSAIHRLLRQGGVLVDGKAATPDQRIHTGELILVSGANETPDTRPRGHKGKSNKPLNSPSRDYSPCKGRLDILLEGAGLLFLNKPAGLAVHGGKRGDSRLHVDSLEDLVRAYLEPKLPPSLSFRPGPLHRLDRPSSGVIVFSTNIEGARFFSSLMRERRIKKTYLALVEGVIEKDEVWEDRLVRDKTLKKTFARKQGAEKAALTRVKPLAQNANASLIIAEIETGRTHQIRAQAASHGHPLVGDRKYGASPLPGGFFLHSWRMEFPDYIQFPGGADVPRMIEAPLSEEFRGEIRRLFGDFKMM